MTNMYRTLDFVFTTDNLEGKEGVVIGPVEDAKMRNKRVEVGRRKVFRGGYEDAAVLSWLRHKFDSSLDVAVILVPEDASRFSVKTLSKLGKLLAEHGFLVLTAYEELGNDDVDTLKAVHFNPGKLNGFLILDHHRHGDLGRVLYANSVMCSFGSHFSLEFNAGRLMDGHAVLIGFCDGLCEFSNQSVGLVHDFLGSLMGGRFSFLQNS